MHVGDTIFIFCLALILFGPKKLPEIGRQIGKLMVEFRRASNEFKLQIEDELRASEEAERQKEIDAAKLMPASAAVATEPGFPPSATNSSAAGESTVPVISPPVTGLPVNHTFGSIENGSPTEPSSANTVSASDLSANDAATAEAGAYPEPGDGFNPGLNTASNGAIAEEPASSLFTSEVVEPTFGKAEAPIHHG